jgi:hypothetical protein
MPIRETQPESDAEVIALQALTWLLSDPTRAERFLALTGLDPAALRKRAGERALLRATIDFLKSHEPDLLAAATALDLPPAKLAELNL